METETDPYIDFTQQDELSNVTLVIEETKLYVHREVLAAWSPVFKTMFTSNFKEKAAKEIPLPDKKVGDVVELLHCMYPPIKPVSASNCTMLLPLAEEYQVTEVKKKCEEVLLTKPGSMKLLIVAQQYRMRKLVRKSVEFASGKSYAQLLKDPYFKYLGPDHLMSILKLRVQKLEGNFEHQKKLCEERDYKLYVCINELVSSNGHYCSECRSRSVEGCNNCLKIFKEKVIRKSKEAKAMIICKESL